MRAELIVIGDELLIGQVLDTNSSWICAHLNEIGVQVKQISTISDDGEEIINALALATSRSDVILMTGGLGPTKDDVTKQTLSRYFNSELVFDEKVLEHVKGIFEKYDRPMLPENIKQAEVLKIAEVLFNKAGTAPGMWIKQGKSHVAIMPGVPSEMKYLMEHEVLPRIKVLPGRKELIQNHILTAGLGESFLAERIAHIENRLPAYIKLAYLPAPLQVRLRLSAEGDNHQLLKEELDSFTKEIKDELKEYCINDNEQTLEETLLDEMKNLNLSLALAESCTGGYVSHLITEIPGSSQVFLGSIVSYDNSVKVNSLGVEQKTLNDFGAVSEQTAIEMAEGVRQKLGSSYSIAITGIAGPGGGSVEKPVGTVWVSIAGIKKTYTFKYLFKNSRNGTIIRASKNALYQLIQLVREENK